MRFHLAAGLPLPAAYEIVRCLDCGAVYADTPGTQADYDRYYTEFSRYEDAATASGGADNEADARRLEDTAAWLAERIGNKDMSIVDVGCGNGGLLQALSRRGYSALAGIDPAPRCVERLNSTGFSAYRGHLGNLPGTCGVYDLVILSHVLEHVVDVTEALRAAYSLLRPGGKIYIETPDASRYHLDGFPPFYFFDPEHINHFDRSSLTTLGARNGFATLDHIEKDLVLPGNRHYPAVGILLQYKEYRPPSPQYDDTLTEQISRYIAVSQAKQRDSEALFADAVKNRPVALWGAGSQAQRLLENSVLKHSHIVAVVDRDSNKQGKFFAGCTVQTPEEGLYQLPADTLVIIAAAIHAEAIRGEIAAIDADLPCFVP